MKRLIKFRGKRIDNGEWVFGDLIHRNDGMIEIHTHLDTWRENPDDVDAYGEEFVVNPDTVGQFTGLHDNNGKEIYEGDIIKQIGYSGNVKAVVQFDKGCFMCGWHHDSSTQRTPRLIQSRCEVLGNIHDTPNMKIKNKVKRRTPCLHEQEDTDYMHWFTDGKEWVLCERQDWEDMYSILCSGYGKDAVNRMSELDGFHRATPEEVAKHFNNTL